MKKSRTLLIETNSFEVGNYRKLKYQPMRYIC